MFSSDSLPTDARSRAVAEGDETRLQELRVPFEPSFRSVGLAVLSPNRGVTVDCIGLDHRQPTGIGRKQEYLQAR